MKIKNIGKLLMVGLAVLSFSSPVFAGDINSYEAQVIAYASGTFTYQGKTYVAANGMIGQLSAYLSEDGVNLTSEGASKAISSIAANVEKGVTAGYLVPIDQPTKEAKEEETISLEEASELQKIWEETTEKTTMIESTRIMEEREGSSEVTSQNLPATEENTSLVITQKASETSTKPHKKSISNFKRFKKILGLFLLGIFVGYSFKFLYKRYKKKSFKKTNRHLTYDMHCHILPGVDDGAKDLAMSLAMLDEEYKEGVRTVIMTPHYTAGSRHNLPKDQLKSVFNQLVEEEKKLHPDMILGLGNEVLYSESLLKDLEEDKICLLPEGMVDFKDHTLLLEFSPREDYQVIYQAILQLTRERYRPIIAHCERYENLEKEDGYQDLFKLGARLQVNCIPKKNEFDPHYRTLAMKLCKRGLISYLSTDAHNLTTRPVAPKEMIGQLEAEMSTSRLDHMLHR